MVVANSLYYGTLGTVGAQLFTGFWLTIFDLKGDSIAVMPYDVTTVYALVAAIVERARLDIVNMNREWGVSRTCEETYTKHPARKCAREFLDRVDDLVYDDDFDSAEFCLEVLDSGNLR